ncbi:MAG TPA: hypothetical protein DER23_07875 [Clostridiales bacterium]|jgi:hypothetical protein|nr:hypothetical protein [Clostridiales bacterium]
MVDNSCESILIFIQNGGCLLESPLYIDLFSAMTGDSKKCSKTAPVCSCLKKRRQTSDKTEKFSTSGA